VAAGCDVTSAGDTAISPTRRSNPTGHAKLEGARACLFRRWGSRRRGRAGGQWRNDVWKQLCEFRSCHRRWRNTVPHRCRGGESDAGFQDDGVSAGSLGRTTRCQSRSIVPGTRQGGTRLPADVVLRRRVATCERRSAVSATGHIGARFVRRGLARYDEPPLCYPLPIWVRSGAEHWLPGGRRANRKMGVRNRRACRG